MSALPPYGVKSVRFAAGVRWLALIPASYYGICAAQHSIDLASYAILRRPPYNPVTIPAEQLAGAAGILCGIWNFIAWWPTKQIKRGDIVCIVIVDLLITGMLFSAIILQGRFTPHSYAYCKDAVHFGVPPDTPSFFRVLNATATAGDLKGECRDYALEWGVGIFTLCLYIMIVLSHILLFKVKPSPKDDEHIWVIVIVLFPVLFTFVTLKMLNDHFQLSGKIAALAHYSKRVAEKWIARSDANISLKLRPDAASHHSAMEELTILVPHKYAEVQSTHYEPWIPFDVLVLVSEHLHQVDIVNLSMTCKRIRAVIGSLNGPSTLLIDHFSRYTCNADGRQRCWGCGVMTCQECQIRSENLDTESSSHVLNCRPTCHACIRTRYIRDHKLKDKHRSCQCYSKPLVQPIICLNCQRIGETALMEQRALRDLSIQQALAGQSASCHSCQKKLSSSGSQFWSCTTCGKECESKLHCPWKRRKTRSGNSEPTKKAVADLEAPDTRSGR